MKSTTLTVLYDGDCGLCDRCVTWLEGRVHGVEFAPMQDEVHESLVVRDGVREWRAEIAVARLLRQADLRRWRAAGLILGWWGIRHLARPIYRWVAAHRAQISSRMGWQACRLPR